MKWISVKDKLPDKMTSCIVYATDKDGCHTIGWCYYNSEGIFCHYEGYYASVTHWIPLPKPPSKE